MKKSTKLTLDELMRRKEQVLQARKSKDTKDLHIASLDSTITIEEPSGSLCRDAVEMEPGEGDKYLCYECIKEPNLKSPELQKAFECAIPMDIVEKIFKTGEIPQIASECMKLAGYSNGVKEVKN